MRFFLALCFFSVVLGDKLWNPFFERKCDKTNKKHLVSRCPIYNFHPPYCTPWKLQDCPKPEVKKVPFCMELNCEVSFKLLNFTFALYFT